MYNNFLTYFRTSYRVIIPVIAIFILVLNIPQFSLFAPRAADMLQTHLLLELFAVIVAILIAVVSWHDQQNDANTKSGILLTGFTIVAAMDLIHALTYDGMPRLFIENSTNRAIFFWLAGRAYVALTLLLLTLPVRLNLSRWTWLFFAVLISVATFWVGTYGLDIVPKTFEPGVGVTTFKRNFEYLLFLTDILLAIIFISRATLQNRRQSFAFATSCLVMAMGEIIFSNYKAPSDFLNIFGHVFKIVSYAFLYQSVFVAAIRLPYLKARQSEARFRSLTELSSDWYWEQDVNFRFTMMSQNDTGAHSISYIGKANWDLPIEGVNTKQWEAHRITLAQHEPYKDFIYQIRYKTEELRTFSVSGIPFYNDNGIFLGYRGIGSDLTERKATEKQIRQLAFHDSLTGLPNRLLMHDHFKQAVAYAARNNKKVALLFLDLDNFKSINDTLGHDIGDALLKEVAVRLAENVRETDTICREGGDEFIIIQPAVDQSENIAPVLLKLIQQLQEPFNLNEIELSTSASIGAAIYPDDGNDFETLRKKADMAMYEAKAAGRNTYQFFDEAMNELAEEHLFLRNGLRRALERNEFILHYQPQIDLASENVIGVEALLRWNHPTLGMVAPGRFIPVAEESGMIVSIGEWVLQEACRQAVAWKNCGLPDMIVAVNLSAVQFRRGNIEQTVTQALQASGLNPKFLELELTESIMIQNAEHVLGSVKRLKLLGLKLSIDDFGTGYSSLSYLKRFDIDKLKIDQSFIRDLASDPDDAAIVHAIIQMAKSLNLKTIAEGVETEDMLQKLRNFKCDEVQGYYYARPMPATEITSYIKEKKSTRR